MEKQYKKLNIFYIPAVVLMILFVAYPLFNAFYLSFFNWNGYSQTKEFFGLKNYISMFQDKNFRKALINTLIYGFGCTALQQVIGLALAMFLNGKFKGRSIVRTVIYMPAMVSGLVMGYIMYFFFQSKGGVINDMLLSLGLNSVNWLGNAHNAVAVIVFINTWQFVGVSMVIYLAGIQGVSQSYIEAAKIDGANSWQLFSKVILPNLLPALSSSVTYNLIGGLKLYDVIIALTDGGPAKKSNSFATYIANRYFDAERAGYAAAVGVFSFIMIMVISTIVNAYFRKKERDLEG